MVYRLFVCVFFLSLSTLTAAPDQHPVKKFNIAFFEAGEHIGHAGMRGAFRDNLESMLPDSIMPVFPASGFFTADWGRDSCKVLAKQIANRADIDIIVTLGPWVIEELLAAGCKKPIIGLYRNDPKLEGLLDYKGRPNASNLTVDTRPGQYENDLRVLTSFVKVKTLGVLCFPSGDEGDRVVKIIDSLGKQQGFETVTGTGNNNKGTFAFFKAYSDLPKKVDALYLMSAWDMTGEKMKAFLEKCALDGVAVFSTEGWLGVERGALLSDREITPNAEGWFAARKALQIMQGALPADLPTNVPVTSTLMINEQTSRLLKLDIPEGALIEANIISEKAVDDADRYNLDYVVRRALNQNPKYQATLEGSSAIDALTKQVKSGYLPQINASVSAFHVDDNSVYNDRGETKNDQISAGLTLEQTVFSMVKIRNMQKGAVQKKQAELNSAKASSDLEYYATLAFFNCLKTNELISAYNRYRRTIDYRLHMAKVWMTENQDNKREFDRLSAERNNATRFLYDAYRDVHNAKIMLNALLNQNWNTEFELQPIGFSEKEFFSESYVVYQALNTQTGRQQVKERFLSDALTQNTELQISRLGIDLQNHALKTNRARVFPELKFHASLNFVDRQNDAPSPFIEKNNTWAFGGELKFPLYLGGDRHHERNFLKAGLNEREYLRDDLSLEIMKNITTEVENLYAQQGKLATSQNESDLLSGLLEELMKKQNNKGNYLEVLDLSKTVLENDLASINARYEFFEGAARLCREIGWSPSQEGCSPSRLIARRIAGIFSKK